jgi:hypothetical protein
MSLRVPWRRGMSWLAQRLTSSRRILLAELHFGFWDVMLCIVNLCQYFGRACRLHFRGKGVLLYVLLCLFCISRASRLHNYRFQSEMHFPLRPLWNSLNSILNQVRSSRFLLWFRKVVERSSGAWLVSERYICRECSYRQARNGGKRRKMIH